MKNEVPTCLDFDLIMSNNNYSIHSIIAAYGLGIAPHGYYLIKMMANAKGQSSNIL